MTSRRARPMWLLMVPACLLITRAPAAAADIYVDAAGGGDYATIGEALQAAHSGDQILVAPGVYPTGGSELVFNNKQLSLRSLLGRESTFIEAGGAGRCISVNGPPHGTCTIEGFTIRDGRAGYGGGIRCVGSTVDIVDCWVEGCLAYDYETHYSWGRGGGLDCLDSVVSVTDCVFADNRALDRGGGVHGRRSHLTISACRFESNTGYYDSCEGGAFALSAGSAEISGCEFIANVARDGAAIMGWDFVETTECTIVESEATDGSAVNLALGTMERNVIGFTGPGQAVSCGTRATIRNCIVFANAGGDSLCGNVHDNLFIDPLLCDVSSGDLHTCSDSPCLPENNDWNVQVGANGSGCGSCGTAVEASSWSSIKALYR